MRFILATAVLVVLAAAVPARAAIHTETVEYKQGATTLKGYLAYDDTSKAKRPGVIVVHEWWGLNDYARTRAEQLAKAGYIAFAIDMYGDGKSTTHPETAGQWAGAVAKDRAVAGARFQAGYDVLAKHPLTRGKDIAAIGYCFGGATVLGAALGGADLKAVVSFHGSLPQEPAAGPIQAKVLVCHGAADSFTTPEQIQTFQKNLDAAKADWQFISYGGAKHSFTNPGADQVGMEGLKYDPAADKRSWQAMQDLFGEVFGK